MSFKAWAAIAAVGLIAWLAVGWTGVEESVPDTVEDAANEDPLVGQAPRRSDSKSPARTEIQPTRPARAETVLDGRCVNENGVPIAGCQVFFYGNPGDEARQAAFHESNETLEWNLLRPVTTGADGRFLFRFLPPPHFVFHLSIHDDRNWCRILGMWNQLTPGKNRHLGDITMVRGAILIGRVVDRQGRGVGGASLYVELINPPTREEETPHVSLLRRGATTAADGCFTFRLRSAPGDWGLFIRSEDVRSTKPPLVHIGAEQMRAEVQIVVSRPLTTHAIRGVVVDSSGSPLAKSSVRGDYTAKNTLTDKNGEFVLRHWKLNPIGEVELSASARGYEDRRGPRVDWGTKNVKIVLQRAVDVTLHVVDGDTGASVPGFALRCHSLASSGGSSWRHYPGGRGVLKGFSRGKHLLFITPADASYSRNSPVEIDVRDRQSISRTVKVYRLVQTRLRVVLSGGQPVAGSEVLVLETVENPGRFQPPQPAYWADRPSGRWGAFQQGGYTDARGELVLRGSKAAKYRVLIRGPGYVPTELKDVVLGDDEDPIEVKVARGSTLRGRIRPQQLVAQYYERLRNDGKMVPTQRIYNTWMKVPGVFLRSENGRVSFPSGGGRSAVQPDGTFTITGIPKGKCRLVLNSVGQSLDASALMEIGTEETKQIDVHLHDHLRGELCGRIFLNGKPIVRSRVLTQEHNHGAKTNAHGRFRMLLPAGNYHIQTPFPFDGQWWMSMFARASETVSIRPGEKITQDFHIWSTRVRGRVLGADGNPRAGVVVHAGPVEWGHSARMSTYRPGRCGCGFLPNTCARRKRGGAS